MNLKKKKLLASRVLKIGVGKIIFNKDRLADIKEALTKQDIKELYSDGAILFREKRGRKRVEKRKTRRRQGSIRKNRKLKKRGYIIIIRKLRRYLAESRKKGIISRDQYIKLRKEIRARTIKDKAHLKEHLQSLSKGDSLK